MTQASEQIAKQYANAAINKKNWGDIAYNALVEGLSGDGVSDDTAKLQALINKAIAADRRTILFPHGQYYVTALTNADQVDFVGDNSSFVGGYTGTIGDLGGFAELQADFNTLEATVNTLDSEFTAFEAEFAKEVPTVFNVQGYGAKCDGVTDDTASIQLAINAAFAAGGGIVYIPYKTVYTTSSLTYKDNVTIWDISDGTINWNDYAGGSTTSTFVTRRKAGFTGGTPGYVNAGIANYTSVLDGVTSFEWGILSVMNNAATVGENVAVYGQGNKLAIGPTWAGVFEARDKTNASTLGGLIGIEVDVFCNGADTGSRVGIDIVVGKGVDAGTAPVATDAIRIGPVNGDSANGSFVRGIHTTGNITTGMKLDHTGTWGISAAGTFGVGIDLSSATISGDAIRIAIGQRIALDQTGTMALKYNSTTGFIEFFNGATRKGYIDMNGADHAL